MQFSPLLISSVIVQPLRYFFTHFAKSNGLIWSEDEKIRTIEIGNINDFHNIKIQGKPRIFVDRGGYSINGSGLTDNLAESHGIKSNLGRSNRTNMVYIQGQAQIIIEARNEGTCDMIADMVSHFLVWSRPLLMDTQGFKMFGSPMQVSSCQIDKEDIEKMKIVINIPYMCEEQWIVDIDALRLKSFFLELKPEFADQPITRVT